MPRTPRRRPSRGSSSYANAAVALALLASVVSGTAVAAGTIGAKQIKPDAVRAKHIKDGQVKAADTGGGVLDACSPGSLAGAVEVDGSASFAGTFTRTGTSGFACRGKALVRRVVEGVYRVCLPAVPSELAGPAVGNSIHQAAQTVGEDNFLTVRHLGVSSDCAGVQVEVRSVDEGGNEALDLQDTEFAVQIAID